MANKSNRKTQKDKDNKTQNKFHICRGFATGLIKLTHRQLARNPSSHERVVDVRVHQDCEADPDELWRAALAQDLLTDDDIDEELAAYNAERRL